jgi:hypothetical protein
MLLPITDDADLAGDSLSYVACCWHRWWARCWRQWAQEVRMFPVWTMHKLLHWEWLCSAEPAKRSLVLGFCRSIDIQHYSAIYCQCGYLLHLHLIRLSHPEVYDNLIRYWLCEVEVACKAEYSSKRVELNSAMVWMSQVGLGRDFRTS